MSIRWFRARLPRLAAAVLLAALLLCAAPAALAAKAPAGITAEAIPAAEVVLSDGQGPAPLLDGNCSTFLSLAEGESLTLRAETPFHSLYLVWDRPPARWRLAGADTRRTPGDGGFLHELVRLEAPAAEVQITFENADYTLCDIYLFGAGEVPDWVQDWHPTLEKAHLLALPTHADDEHLFFGGILPTYAGERGLDVQVVYLTNHWGERYRPHELLDGLWTVGVRAYPVMGPFPDLFASKESLAAAEATYGRAEVLDFQVEQLRRFRPLVVVGHDLAGEYGHGAHILGAVTLVEALELAADEAAHPASAQRYGVWDVPKTYLHLYAENQLVMDWNTPLPAFGGATAFEMAVAGFAKHASQQEYFQVRQGGTWEDCRLFGLIRTTVGPDVARDDLFENIDLSPEPPPEPDSVPVSSEPAPPTVSQAPAPASASQLPHPPAGDGSLPLLILCLAGAAVAVAALAALLVVLRRRGPKGP